MYIRIIISFVFFIFISSVLTSQTLDEIIARHVEALGGMEKLVSVKSMKVTGKYGSGSFELPFTQIIKRPASFYLELSMQGLTMKQVYDGTSGWTINTFQGKKEPEPANEEEIKFMKDMSDIEGKLVNYKEKSHTAEYIGKEDLEGSEVFKIKLTDKDSKITYYYLDVATYLIIKESGKMKFKEKEYSQDTYFGDYKSIDGFMIAHSIEIKSLGAGVGESQKATVEKVELNLEVDDSIFKMPAK
jgi:hypothetical protein